MATTSSRKKPASSSSRRTKNPSPTNACHIATTSASSPALFQVVEGHVSFPEPRADNLKSDGKFHVSFKVRVPNYTVSLNFEPHDFLNRGSRGVFKDFKQIRKKAVEQRNFDEKDLHQLLLPFMKLFRREAPREDVRDNYDVLSLRDVEFRGWWELKCTYTNEKPEIQAIDQILKASSFRLPPNIADGSVFPILSYRDVLVPSNKGPHSRNRHFLSHSPPKKVKINDQSYFYHPLTTSIDFIKKEIDQHMQIISAGFSCEGMRILPLRGIVLDDENEVVGLLKGWQSTYDEDFLERVLSENEVDPDDLKSWVTQFDIAVDGIRRAGLQIDPKVWDVAVNKRGEVWIAYLEDGRAPHHELGLYHWSKKGMPGMHDFLGCLEKIYLIDNLTGDICFRK